MDRQARKLQIAREQQGLHEGSTTSINPNETTDSHSTTTGNAAGGTSLGGGLASSATRVSDLSVLSDDDDKEVIIYIQDITPAAEFMKVNEIEWTMIIVLELTGVPVV